MGTKIVTLILFIPTEPMNISDSLKNIIQLYFFSYKKILSPFSPISVCRLDVGLDVGMALNSIKFNKLY